MLSIEEVKKVASLSRIKLEDNQVEQFRQDLSSILDYVDELKTVDTSDLAIVANVTGLENISRDDVAVEIDYQDGIMQNAPEIKDGYYKVHSIL